MKYIKIEKDIAFFVFFFLFSLNVYSQNEHYFENFRFDVFKDFNTLRLEDPSNYIYSFSRIEKGYDVISLNSDKEYVCLSYTRANNVLSELRYYGNELHIRTFSYKNKTGQDGMIREDTLEDVNYYVTCSRKVSKR
tara:strand:- start:2724 stop:3131 length:408 start_codon:yes stop_codon:yes gene_type:complete